VSVSADHRPEGEKASIVKPLHGFGSGRFEVALPRRQKRELEVVAERLKRLKEMLR
jgi:hypothetical protein